MITDSAVSVLRGIYKYPSTGVRLYSYLRLAIFPMDWFSHLVDNLSGEVLCLGCGYGVLETVIAIQHPSLQITASDVDEHRIVAAQKAVKNVFNISFSVLDVTVDSIYQDKKYDIIIFADLLHHLGCGEQEKLLNSLWNILRQGGVLIMKDVDTRPKWKYWWNYFHDSIMAGPPLIYKSSEYYESFFTEKKAVARYERFNRWWLPYNHYALIITKK